MKLNFPLSSAIMSCIPAKEIKKKKKKNLIAMCFWFQIDQISIGSSQFLFDKKKKKKKRGTMQDVYFIYMLEKFWFLNFGGLLK